MPYIRKEDRKLYDEFINEIVDALVNKFPGDNGRYFDVGDLNYVISSIVWKLWDKLPCYKRGNELVGALSCAKSEFQRRKLDIYEKSKIIENGDL